MTTMRPTVDGDATPVPTSLLSVLVSWRSTALLDAHAVLLNAAGRVRSARDVVYFNAPRHPSQAVTVDQDPQPGTARLSVSLPRTEAEIVRILITGSAPDEPLTALPGLAVSVEDAEGLVARADVAAEPDARAAVFGEFRRAEDRWWFVRGGPQHADAAELFTTFGAPVADSAQHRSQRVSLHRTRFAAPMPPPQDDRPDWHPDPADAASLRWWDGSRWTEQTVARPPADPRGCPRCGRRRGWRLLGAAPCRACAAEIEDYLSDWRIRALRVLTTTGPSGPDWDELWTWIRHRRIDFDTARAALRGPAVAHLERTAAFALADGTITGAELERFDATVAALGGREGSVDELRRSLRRLRILSRLRAGELPVIAVPDLHLDPQERVHLDTAATRLRRTGRGTHASPGRLICSNRKLRFIGPDAGIEIPWTRAVSVSVTETGVTVAATSARGGAEFDVAEPELVAAIVEGALRVAKRLTVAPGRRDSRSIAPDIKAEVWHRDGGRCVECGATHYLEFDHIIPLSRGGATSAANLQILCRGCNRDKGDHI
ncbi:stress response protein SCP2 [Nocardia kruczakiae]|uniref:Stress response protein SCP2 n=1 Tax=Nocardia kruczakiae TaxID=261477 RepID=A0ABU1XFK6_9NOCA|nr:HNH endonuclease [Nocardia kruczakiae]MDR7169328.1 stress response protein SCP2 [Nocardia kruczakiae]